MLLARRPYLFGLMLLPACAVMQASAQQTPAVSASGDERLLEQVAEFLEHFIDPQKTPEQQAALFTRDAQYYEHGKVGPAAIRRDVEYYSRRWPYRDYRLSEIHYITPDPSSDRIFVSYAIEYRVANRAKAASGKAHYGAVLVNPHTAPQIEWIKEEITN